MKPKISDELKQLMVEQMKTDGYPVDVGGYVALPQCVGVLDCRQDNEDLKEELVGSYYKVWPSDANRYMRIINCYMINTPHYIWDGLALLVDDNMRRFGCPREFIISKEEFNRMENGI